MKRNEWWKATRKQLQRWRQEPAKEGRDESGGNDDTSEAATTGIEELSLQDQTHRPVFVPLMIASVTIVVFTGAALMWTEGQLVPILHMITRVAVILTAGSLLVVGILMPHWTTATRPIWTFGAVSSVVWLTAAVANSKGQLLIIAFYGTWGGLYVISLAVLTVGTWFARALAAPGASAVQQAQSRIYGAALFALSIVAIVFNGLIPWGKDGVDSSVLLLVIIHIAAVTPWVGALLFVTAEAARHIRFKRVVSDWFRGRVLHRGPVLVGAEELVEPDGNQQANAFVPDPDLVEAVRRYSVWIAMPCAITVIVTAGLLALSAGYTTITDTPYGTLLIAKGALLLCMMVIAAVNKLYTVPRMMIGELKTSRFSPDWYKRLQRSAWEKAHEHAPSIRAFVLAVGAEITLMIMAITLAVLLTVNRPW